MAERFPKPYLDSVPKDPENTPQMQYTTFPKMGIGARMSGMPKNNVNGINSLDHVGTDATTTKR